MQIGIGTIGTTDDILLLHANILFQDSCVTENSAKKGSGAQKCQNGWFSFRVTDLICAQLYFDVGNGVYCFDGTHNKVEVIAVSLFYRLKPHQKALEKKRASNKKVELGVENHTNRRRKRMAVDYITSSIEYNDMENW